MAHVLVGYDPKTERLSYRHEIPRSRMKDVLNLIQLDPDDPDAIAAYALDIFKVNDIWGIIGETERDPSLEYFLESRSHPAA
ncbi:MAG TPA: hypothetical protein VGH40_04815 [Roseiarcus sp.]